MSTYIEINGEKQVNLNPDGGTTALTTYFAGNRNDVTNSVTGNYDKTNITYYFDNTATWISSVLFTRINDTAGKITLTYNKNLSGNERLLKLHLHNIYANSPWALKLVQPKSAQVDLAGSLNLYLGVLTGRVYDNNGNYEASIWTENCISRVLLYTTYNDSHRAELGTYKYIYEPIISWLKLDTGPTNLTVSTPIIYTEWMDPGTSHNIKEVVCVDEGGIMFKSDINGGQNVECTLPAYQIPGYDKNGNRRLLYITPDDANLKIDITFATPRASIDLSGLTIYACTIVRDDYSDVFDISWADNDYKSVMDSKNMSSNNTILIILPINYDNFLYSGGIGEIGIFFSTNPILKGSGTF